MKSNVGHTSTGNFSRKAALFAFSVSMLAKTTSFSKALKASRVKTCSFIATQVWHHGAQASTKSSFFCAFASFSALP